MNRDLVESQVLRVPRAVLDQLVLREAREHVVTQVLLGRKEPEVLLGHVVMMDKMDLLASRAPKVQRDKRETKVIREQLERKDLSEKMVYKDQLEWLVLPALKDHQALKAIRQDVSLLLDSHKYSTHYVSSYYRDLKDMLDQKELQELEVPLVTRDQR